MEKLVDGVLLVGYEEVEPPEWIRRAAPDLGGVVLYGQNLPTDADAPRLGRLLSREYGALVATDEEGGDVTRLHYRSGSPVPGNHVLGTVDDVAMTTAVAYRIGSELRDAGIHFDLAPDADVNVDPDNPVIGVRSFGSDPALVSRHTAAWVLGLQAAGVAGCAKHFPGHGDTHADSHHELPTTRCTEAQWRRDHLPPFVAAITAGVRAIMTAHVVLPALDPDGPSTVSRRILTDLLRGELGFDGVVVTDALEMAGLQDRYGVAGGAVRALVAGADALCLGAQGGEVRYREVRDAVLAAVADGTLPVERLEQAAARVGRLRRWADEAVHEKDQGLEAARRAAVARGVAPLAGAPVVIELRHAPNLAVGEAAWDLGGPLAALGFAPVRTVGADGVDAAVAGPDPVVVVGRDVARHDWQRDVWAKVRAARPDAVLVDLGLPRPDLLDGTATVLVGGAGRPNLRAAAELLVTGS
jgi:beta-N-acetylhexosaminidase